ncbi:GNAT family N-acetyltransferase [Eionea flava]
MNNDNQHSAKDNHVMANQFCSHTVDQWLSDAKERCIDGSQRLSYLLELRRLLPSILADSSHTSNSANAISILAKLVELADLLCDWPLRLVVHQQYMQQPDASQLFNNSDPATLLAETYQHMGRYDLAKHVLRLALLAHPDDQRQQQAWRYACESSTPLVCTEKNDLWITPLLVQHLYDFAWQYNESIQALCNLPVFTENDDWHYWLDDMQNDPHREVFAIFHQEWGFIGSVSLQLYDGVGFFYYWLGEDFQGMGLGPQAVELLMQWGEQQGMTCCYAKIYADNIPSHKAIQKIGFQPLPFAAAAPDEHEVFYYRGANKPEHQLFQGLKYLLYAMNSDIQPVPNQQTIAA